MVDSEIETTRSSDLHGMARQIDAEGRYLIDPTSANDSSGKQGSRSLIATAPAMLDPSRTRLGSYLESVSGPFPIWEQPLLPRVHWPGATDADAGSVGSVVGFSSSPPRT